MKLFLIIVTLTTIVATASDSSSVRAQVVTPPVHSKQPNLTSVNCQQKYGPMEKVGSDLVWLWAEYQAYAKIADPHSFQATNSSLQIYDGRVAVDAIASGDTDILLADLEQLGLQNISTYGSFVSGLLPIEDIAEMAELASLKFARPTYRPAINGH